MPEHIGIVGSGSMGSGMSQLFAEKGSAVSIFDTDSDIVESVVKRAKENRDLPEHSVKGYSDIKSFMAALKPNNQKHRIIVLSLPHGKTIDKVLDEIEPLTDAGDIVMDGANEWWEDTERRQKRCQSKEFGNGPISWIGLGVSGGYQAARRGPSLCPGGDKEAYDKVKHLLLSWACPDSQGRPCVNYMGKGGAGHHIKCLHNGIEQGILSAVCEVYGLMRHSLGYTNDQIGDIFANWASQGGLVNNFLVQLGAEILHFKKGDGIRDDKGIVRDIEDKVVQDADDTEGTGVWTMREFGARHVAAPTIAAAHCLRIVSSNKEERLKVYDLLKLPQMGQAKADANREELHEKLHKSLYIATLASFVQGLNVIARAVKDEQWGSSLKDCVMIWRAGCIIQSDYISDMLESVYEQDPELDNLLLNEKICSELRSGYQDLKDVCAFGISIDAVIPSLSATLEYLKSCGAKMLPTNFEETEMDAFGTHSYDLKSEHAYKPVKGKHHTEFRPA